MASVGLPGTANFVGEFLSLVGAYEISTWVAFVATTGVILGAAYMLYLYARIAYGSARTPEAAAMADLTPRELATLVPLALATLWMGVYPESFIAPMRNDVGAILARLAPTAPHSDSKVVMGHPKQADHAPDHQSAEAHH
jgi:NADH-quinone oxidoreductase subunit M